MFVFCCLTEEADDDGVWGCFGRDCCRLPRQLLHVNNNQQTNTIEGQLKSTITRKSTSYIPAAIFDSC